MNEVVVGLVASWYVLSPSFVLICSSSRLPRRKDKQHRSLKWDRQQIWKSFLGSKYLNDFQVWAVVGASLCCGVFTGCWVEEAISHRPRNQPQSQSWRILSTQRIMENHSIPVSLDHYRKRYIVRYFALDFFCKTGSRSPFTDIVRFCGIEMNHVSRLCTKY